MNIGVAGRNELIDKAKGFGIALVVFGHALRGVHAAGIGSLSNEKFMLIDSLIYSFHMPLFFFLTGVFVIPSLMKRGVGEFVFDKLRRLIYPYVVWSILQGAVEWVMGRYTNGHVSLIDVLMFPVAPRAQFWFLYVVFIILTASALLINKTLSLRKWVAIFSSSIILYFVVPLESWWVVGSVFGFSVFVIFSYKYGARVVELLSWRPRFWLFILSAIFICFEFLFHFSFKYNYQSAPAWARLLVASSGIAFSLALCANLNGVLGRVASALGKRSLEIYLLHIIIASGARVVLHKAGWAGGTLSYATATTVFALAVSWFVAASVQRLGVSFVFSFPSGRRLGGSVETE